TMTANASPHTLPELLGDIYLGGRTGVLSLARGGERVGISFREGRVVSAEAAPLGREGEAGARPADPLSRQLARVLAELEVGRASGAPAGRAIGREPVLEALGWPEATFADGEVGEAADSELRLSTEEVVLEAVRRLSRDEVKAALDDDRVLALAVNP